MAQQYVILQFRNYSENTTTAAIAIRPLRIQAIKNGIDSLFTGVSTTTFNYSAWDTILRSASGSSYYQTVTIPVSGSKQTVPYNFTSTAKQWFTSSTSLSSGGAIDMANAIYTGGGSASKIVTVDEVQTLTFPYIFDEKKYRDQGGATAYTPSLETKKCPIFSNIQSTTADEFRGRHYIKYGSINLDTIDYLQPLQCVRRNDIYIKYSLTIVNLSPYDIGLNVTANNETLWSTMDSSSSLGSGVVDAKSQKVITTTYPQYISVSNKGAYIDYEDDSYNTGSTIFQMQLGSPITTIVTEPYAFTLLGNETLYVDLNFSPSSDFEWQDNTITVTAHWQGDGVVLWAEAEYAVYTRVSITLKQTDGDGALLGTTILTIYQGDTKNSLNGYFNSLDGFISVSSIEPTSGVNYTLKKGQYYKVVLDNIYDN